MYFFHLELIKCRTTNESTNVSFLKMVSLITKQNFGFGSFFFPLHLVYIFSNLLELQVIAKKLEFL